MPHQQLRPPRRLTLPAPPSDPHFTLWHVGSQRLHLASGGGCLVCGAGPLAARAPEKPLRAIADLAQRLPGPRSPGRIEHPADAPLTRAAYPTLAGYPDFHDARDLRHAPLLQALADTSPDAGAPLASPSTPARFRYAFARRQAGPPPEERPVPSGARAAQAGRLKVLNDCPAELFLRTRRAAPAEVVPGADAGDGPVHGHQTLGGHRGHSRQRQRLPPFVCGGAAGFPPAARLRPGTVRAGPGAAEIIGRIATAPRAARPGPRIGVRSGNGPAVPGPRDCREADGLPYVLGHATDPALRRATAQAPAGLELCYRSHRRRGPVAQRHESARGYQADTWRQPRRIVAGIEATPQGGQRRFAVTDHTGPPAEVCRGSCARRGRAPGRPVGGMKSGSRADRLPACGPCANAFRLPVRTPACASAALFREAAAAPEAATATVGARRQRPRELAARVVTSPRRTWPHLSESWPCRGLWVGALAAARGSVGQVPAG